MSADRAETTGFTRIVMKFVVSGARLPWAAVKRAVQMSR